MVIYSVLLAAHDYIHVYMYEYVHINICALCMYAYTQMIILYNVLCTMYACAYLLISITHISFRLEWTIQDVAVL